METEGPAARADPRGGGQKDLQMGATSERIRRVVDGKRFAANILFYPSFLVLTAVTIVPIAYVLFNSLRTYWLADPSKTKFIWLGNYAKMFRDRLFLHSLEITAITVIAAVALEVLIGLILALILERDSRAMKYLRGVILVPMMLTPIVIGLLWKFMYDASFGILNYLIKSASGLTLLFLGSYHQALASVIIVEVWQWTPFAFLMISAGLKSIDPQLYEAAAIDGSNKLRSLLHITLPLLRNIIIITALFRTIDVLKLFDIVYAMTGGGPSDATMVLGVYNYRIGFKFFNIGYGSSIAVFQVALMGGALSLLTKVLKVRF
jgi:multiple sugar transport system permease protein